MTGRQVVVVDPWTAGVGVVIGLMAGVALSASWLTPPMALVIWILVAVSFALMFWTGGLRLEEVPDPLDDALDVCQCGDFRRVHVKGKGVCRLCLISTSPYEVCTGFVLWIRAREWTEEWAEMPDNGNGVPNGQG
jgi:hypothetical protein